MTIKMELSTVMHMEQLCRRCVMRCLTFAVAIGAVATGCTNAPKPEPHVAMAGASAGSAYTVRDTTLVAAFDAAGVAGPIQQATLSTKLMGTVIEVLVKEGDRVAAGAPLLRIDARDLSAKSAQAAASITEAEAMHRDALTQADRIRALYADSVATRAQLDAAETGLARAQAGLEAARAVASELSAVGSYAVIRAPFLGVVTKRFVDAGAFAAPGAPLVAIQDVSTLRITANATPEVARRVHRGQKLMATIEGAPLSATVEGVVPSLAGNMYTINALVPNGNGALLAGSTATLALPTGSRVALVVPAAAIAHEGDLTGVTLRTAGGDERRWVRFGWSNGVVTEVTAGLHAGDQVVLPPPRLAASAEK
jgi:RND family efflux transporter MFP subunit